MENLSGTMSIETIRGYKSLLQDLKKSYKTYFRNTRELIKGDNPNWVDIERAQNMQGLMELYLSSLVPTDPDYFESHDNAFIELSQNRGIR